MGGGRTGPIPGWGFPQARKHLPSPSEGAWGRGRGPESPVSSVPTRALPPAHARSLPGPRRLAQGPSGKLDLKADNF